jgi:cobalamin biosynthetic protein CobC
MLEHGGGILAAARRYGIPVEQWVDLSTGLNPHGWPVPDIPPQVWQRLPETDDGLEQAAAAYYGSELLLPVAGSQPAIQALPQLRSAGTVGMLAATYAEHPHAWTRHGHQVLRLQPDEIDAALDRLDVLLLCHPNNPTGWRVMPEVLLGWHARLAARGAWLVVDEAFIDATPQDSLIRHIGMPGLVALRSIGKFFGLAGARAGFVFAWPSLLTQLRELLGPWTVSGPARVAVRGALQDHAWHAAMRERLAAESARLASLLSGYGLKPHGGTALFQWLPHPQALALHTALAERAILTRYFAESASLRFGLPADEAEWTRLSAALQEIRSCN